MFSEDKDKEMQRIQGYLSSPSGQNALKALGPLGNMREEDVLKQVWRIIPKDYLPEAMQSEMGIQERSKFSDELEKPGFFGERLESEGATNLLEHIKKMGL